MIEQRKGNDIKVAWSITKKDGQPFSIEGLNVRLYLKSMFGKKELNDFVVTGNIIQWTFYGKDQKSSGKYSLELVVNEGEKGMITTDACDFVNLVSCSCQLNGGKDEDGVETESIELESKVDVASGEVVTIVVDEVLSETSVNPVQNKVITAELNKKANKTEIPTKMSQLEQDIEIGGDVDLSEYPTKKEVSDNYQPKGDYATATELTELSAEVNEVAEKIDNINPTPMISVTYAELVALRDNGELVAGMQYRITDYVTTTAQENTRSAGHPFDVIVTADNENTLNEVARACKSEFDIEKYKDAYSHSLGENMRYMGTYEYNGEVYHYYESYSCSMLVSFNEAVEYDASSIHPYTIMPSYIMLDGEIWGIGTDAGENIAFKHNPTIASYFKDSNLAAWQIWYSLDNDAERFAWADTENGKGVIYRMIDEWNNDCPYDFKNIQFKRYIIEADNAFATDVAKGGEIEIVKAKLQEMSHKIHTNVWYYGEYISDVYPDANPETRYVPFGDIDYYNAGPQVLCEIDENNYGWFYTFHNEGEDASLLNVDENVGVYDNTIKDSCYVFFVEEGTGSGYTRINAQSLNNIVFVGNDCNYNSFGNDCHSNSFGNRCSSNSFGNYYNYSSFGNRCSYNSFGSGCNYYSFGSGCNYNSFGNDCYSNSFGNECGFNSFGSSCNYNSFGNDCYSNSFGNRCYSNSFGNDCHSNSFGNECGFNSFKGNNFRYIAFGNGGRQLKLRGGTDDDRFVQNVRVAEGFEPDDGVDVELSVDRGSLAETTILMIDGIGAQTLRLQDLLDLLNK